MGGSTSLRASGHSIPIRFIITNDSSSPALPNTAVSSTFVGSPMPCV